MGSALSQTRRASRCEAAGGGPWLGKRTEVSVAGLAQLSLTFSPTVEDGVVLADPHRLAQVVSNLIRCVVRTRTLTPGGSRFRLRLALRLAPHRHFSLLSCLRLARSNACKFVPAGTGSITCHVALLESPDASPGPHSAADLLVPGNIGWPALPATTREQVRLRVTELGSGSTCSWRQLRIDVRCDE
jgi:hypothetical protein